MTKSKHAKSRLPIYLGRGLLVGAVLIFSLSALQQDLTYETFGVIGILIIMGCAIIIRGVNKK